MAAQPKLYLTPDEYLEMERQAEYRSEYFAGQIVAMAGANKRHNLIVANAIRIFGNQLLDRPCNVYPSDMRVKIEVKPVKLTYPDVVITCGDEQFDDEHNDNLLNPLVLIEVLSASTEAYDRGKKFEHYQRIPSLAEYLLVAQEPYRVEQYVRQTDRSWTHLEYHSSDDVVRLVTINCELALADLYRKVV